MGDKVENAGRARWRLVGWTAFTAAVLMIPLVAMQFTNEVNWTLFDFIFAGAMLLGVGVAYEFLTGKSAKLAYRAGVATGLAAAFAIVWATGAVGIIGSEAEPANLLFFAVIAVAFGGAIAAGFKPAGMAWAMFAASALQASIGGAALLAGWGAADPSYPLEILGATAFFTAMWTLAGLLFQNSSKVA